MTEETYKSGFVTLVGKPNVGKSTLLNRLVGQPISITANKPQTTRNRIRGIVTTEKCQAVIMDTPGIHLPENELHKRIVTYATSSIREADLVVFITEPLRKGFDTISKADQLVLEHLKGNHPGVILLINKIDLSNDEQVLKSIAIFNESFEFRQTIPISALKGVGVDILRRLFLEYLPRGVPYYPADQMTDSPERVIVAEFVREQITRNCFQEVPYGVAVVVDAFKETGDILKIFSTIFVEKESHKKIIIGRKGAMLKEVGRNSRRKMESLLGSKVYLSLHVKVSRNWVNNPNKLSEFGYSKG